jgi:hypothetical protein
VSRFRREHQDGSSLGVGRDLELSRHGGGVLSPSIFW